MFLQPRLMSVASVTFSSPSSKGEGRWPKESWHGDLRRGGRQREGVTRALNNLGSTTRAERLPRPFSVILSGCSLAAQTELTCPTRQGMVEALMHPEPTIDTDRIDDAVLALLFLGICHRDRDTGAVRAWKSFDRTAMNRLHENGLIQDPVNKAKSVWLTDEGIKRAEALFYKLFAKIETTRDGA